MTGDQWLKLAEIFVSLVQVCIWPLILAIVVLCFRVPLKKFLDNFSDQRNASEVSLKVGATGVEATIKRQVEAAAILGAAAETQLSRQHVPPEDRLRQIVETVSNTLSNAFTDKLHNARVLWVDDRPWVRAYARKALETFGARITLSLSNQDAVNRLQAENYDIIISNMNRAPDPRAGYTLLEELKAKNIKVPYIIYASDSTPEQRAETRNRGAFAATSSPQELVQLATEAIRKS